VKYILYYFSGMIDDRPTAVCGSSRLRDIEAARTKCRKFIEDRNKGIPDTDLPKFPAPDEKFPYDCDELWQQHGRLHSWSLYIVRVPTATVSDEPNIYDRIKPGDRVTLNGIVREVVSKDFTAGTITLKSGYMVPVDPVKVYPDKGGDMVLDICSVDGIYEEAACH
jgi:hypothetical protein